MRAYECGDYAASGQVRLVERPDPAPGPGEALVAIRATGPNARDFAIMRGEHGALPDPTHRIPLTDNAGEVLAVGDGVTEVAPGDRVTMTHYWRWLDRQWDPAMAREDFGVTIDGFLAERRTVPAAALIRLPDTMSFEAAATLQSAGLTAWNAIVEAGQAKPGETVVTLGTGGVSVFALQWAKLKGCRAVITSSSDDKLARMRTLGADAMINYRSNPDWPAAVTAFTGGRGADIVVNTVGLSELDNCLTAAAPGGRILFIGWNAVTADRKPRPIEPPKRMGSLIMRNLTLRGVVVGSRAMFVDMIAAMDANGIEPLIDSVWPFDQASDALAHAAGGDRLGKVVISIP